MNTSHNTYDPITDLILSKDLRIESVLIKENRLFIFIINQKVFIDSLENHKRLKSASLDDLNDFRLIAKGTGIHWPAIDEDLSLYGFLKDYFTKNFQQQRELVIA